ncbi:MAG: YceI family protein [Planctomycetota bacterium]
MRGESRAGFETTFTIQRSAFGMTTMPGGLGDEVRITVSVEGVKP